MMNRNKRSQAFHIEAHAVRDLGLREAKDPDIFNAARKAGAVVMSKDADFRLLVERLGPLVEISDALSPQ